MSLLAVYAREHRSRPHLQVLECHRIASQKVSRSAQHKLIGRLTPGAKGFLLPHYRRSATRRRPLRRSGHERTRNV